MRDTSWAPLVAGWATAVGAVLGSFLNVVIARVPAGQSIVRPPSRCPACGGAIAWYDNVPVLSWILLRARCRRCAARISVRYPAVELLCAGAAWLAWWRHDLGGAWAAELAFVCALVALAFIDIDTWLLPNVITFPLIGAGILAGALGVAPSGGLRASALGAATGVAAFWLVSWVGEKVFKKEALGLGDVWLLGGIGAWLGLRALLPVVLLASVQGSVVGIALLLAGKGQSGSDPGRAAGAEDEWIPPRNAVPFGPFLVLAALEWLYVSGALVSRMPLLEPFR
jgi:leader peptidase (prepilin peptidase)/N-methyltransferase